MRSLLLEEIKDWIEVRGFDPYRASQLAGWLYNRPPTPVEAMHNVPQVLREALAQDFDVSLPECALREESADGTTKLLVRLGDGAAVESVLIPREDRITFCLSSQVGCALDCSFCATARMGLLRNLEPFEMVVQVMLARAVAAPHPLTNYVFMGMGEPLANYDRLLRTIEIMTARWGLGISPRRITVSTVGLVPQLERLARDTAVNLAISLGAPRDEVRERLMPVNKRYPLARLIEACRRLDLPRRKRITVEYTMLDGINDSDRDAGDLVRLLHGLRVKLNLIPFNAFPGAGFACSSPERINAFQEKMLAAGVHTIVRQSRGGDIKAACGQLVASQK